MTTGRHGIRVAVTRPRLQSAELTALLAESGYEPIEIPLLDIQALPVADESWDALERSDAVVVTSPSGAHHLVEALRGTGRRIPETVTVAAVGRITEAALLSAGIRVSLTPERATGAALADALAERGVEGARVVLARALEGRVELSDGLRASGAEVTELPLYRAVSVTPDVGDVERARSAHVWTLTSPKIVDAAVAAVGSDTLAAAALVSIGPTTTAHVRRRGLQVAAEAAEQSAPGLVAAVAEAMSA